MKLRTVAEIEMRCNLQPVGAGRDHASPLAHVDRQDRMSNSSDHCSNHR
jgi:hypothetical protein